MNVDFIAKLELYVVPLDVHGMVFGFPFMYMCDTNFIKRSNQYSLIKDGKFYTITVHKGKSIVFPMSAKQAKKLINSSKR